MVQAVSGVGQLALLLLLGRSSRLGSHAAVFSPQEYRVSIWSSAITNLPTLRAVLLCHIH
jgi:hypothetical protein